MFDGDGCRNDSHRAKVHDPDDKQDHHQTDTGVAAVEAEARAERWTIAAVVASVIASVGGVIAAWPVLKEWLAR